jgi:succinyl-CoA synthetase alpha subunit
MLIDKNTRVIVQGITGATGSLHTEGMLNYGTRIVAGVRPGAAGQKVHDVPVYDTMKDAMREEGGDASILFLPPRVIKSGALEAIDAGIKLMVIVAEHIPLHDSIQILEYARKNGVRVIGPNTSGIINPKERCKIGFVPDRFFTSGDVVVASRSGSLMYEMASRLTRAGLGQRMCIGVGGDPIVGTRFAEVVRMAEEDRDAKATLLIGEIGGTQEEEVSELVKDGAVKKPVFAYIVGRYAPRGKAMGHAGAIVAGGKGTIESKLGGFSEAGITIGETPGDMVEKMAQILRVR